jgi:hypothetical protein
MQAKVLLKRILMRKLILLPNEVTERMAAYEPPVEIPPSEVCKEFKILYATGKK